MKKIILSLAVIFVMSSFTMVDTNAVEVNLLEINNQNEGPARDCVDSSKDKAIFAAWINGGDPMDYYMAYYIECLFPLESID